MSTLKEQIFDVLAESYPEPLHYKAVTEELVNSGAWEKLPKTPANTVSNRITSDIASNGDTSHFVRVGDKGSGLYTVNPTYIVDQTPTTSSSSMMAFFYNVWGSFFTRLIAFTAVIAAVAYGINWLVG